jgi:amino acid permease
MAPSYPEDGAPETSTASSVTRDEKISKAKAVMGMGEGSSSAINSDDELLASLGYRAELKREFSYLTVFGQSFGAMGIAPAIAESIIFSLGSGGSVGMVWTYLVGCILLVPVALSLGELGSSMPTSGGLYCVRFPSSRSDVWIELTKEQWVARLTPPRQRAFMCWLAFVVLN